ncbi:reactive mitochondrial oxygen species modulator 1-domain-containing protein [Cladochytrium replicatum]|nr:reactive mitochondrial oxygen species modulator 1-domain-containing protein [Cladochytrium replicatum]
MQEPSWFDRLRYGAFIGISVGASLGFLTGAFTVLTYGPGRKGYMRTIGQQMMQSSAFFGCIMGFGSLLRSEGAESPRQITYSAQRRGFENRNERE